jgi:hypothetical protein
MLTDGFHHLVKVVNVAFHQLELAGRFVNHFRLRMNSEWSGEGETGKHRVKTPQTQALIYTQNKNRSAPNRPGYRHASYHLTADRWLKGWLGPHVAYHHWWPAKWQFLYLIVFSPLGRPLVLFCISHWRMVPGHVSRAAAACTPESIKVCSVIFVPWSRVQYLLEWLCPLTPHLIPHRILKFILCGCLLKMNERKSTTGQ